MKNLGLKILAVIITLVLYAFVNSQSNQTELTLSLPVKFKNLPESKFILLPVNRQVQVTLRGPAHKISPAASGLFFEVNLPSEIENKLQISLTSQNLNLPVGLEAYNINPSKLDLILDDIITKEVKVEVLTIGQVNNDIKLLGINSEPTKVKVKGPSSEVNQILTVETLPIDLRAMKESGESLLELRAPGSSISLETDKVKVTFSLASLAVERQFVGLPLELRADGEIDYQPETNLINLEVSGPSYSINKLKENEIIPYVKINKKLSNDFMANVRVDLPEDISLIKIEPEQVKLIPVKK